MTAAPLPDRRGYFGGTPCANCGAVIRRVRETRPGRTDLLGDWIHPTAGIRDPRICATAEVSA